MRKKVEKTFDAAKRRLRETEAAYKRAVIAYNRWVSRLKKIPLKGKKK